MGVDVSKALSGAARPSGKDDVPPNEYLKRLMARETPSEILPFPRRGPDGKPVFEYRMRLLTQRELDACSIDADRFTRKQFLDNSKPSDESLGAARGEAWTEVYNNAKIIEMIQRACMQPDKATDPKTGVTKTNYSPLFYTCEQIRSLLTGDELAALYNAYLNLEFKYGPLFRHFTPDDLDDAIKKLEEGFDHDFLSALGSGQLIALVISLASRLRNLNQDTSPSSLPQDDGTNDESESQVE